MKILIVRFSSIGDIVLTSPVLRCLKKQLNTELHFLTKSSFEEIVSPNPYVDKVFTIKHSVTEVAHALRKEKYDHVIDLHKNLRSVQLQVLLGKRALSFDKANLAKWRMTYFLKSKLEIDHIVHRYMKAVYPLAVHYDGGGLDYFIDPDKVGHTRKDKPYICLAIGGAHYTKRLPASKLIALCQAIRSPVVLIGGPLDNEVAVKIKSVVNHVENLCGLVSLSESAQLIKNASLVITHDTGAMHIAAAFQRPIISIWGNTVPEFGMHPFFPSDNKPLSWRSEVSDLPCRPCSKIGFESCPQGHFKCMELQSVDKIVEQTEKLLSSNLPD